jgi:hypothetical protein
VVEATELRLVLGERTVGAPGTLPAGVDVLVEPDGDRVLAQ